MSLPITQTQLDSLTEEAFREDLTLQALVKGFKDSLEAQGCSDKTLEFTGNAMKLSYASGATFGAGLALELLTTHLAEERKQAQSV